MGLAALNLTDKVRHSIA